MIVGAQDDRVIHPMQSRNIGPFADQSTSPRHDSSHRQEVLWTDT